MNLQVFCYLGLLRFPEQLELSLALLPEEQRGEAASFLATLKEAPKAELLRRWSRLREEEWVGVRRKARERTRIPLEDMAPSVKRWCLEWLDEQDGRENPQR